MAVAQQSSIPATARPGTGSLRKALRLVVELGAAEAEGLRLTELVGRTNMDTSTAYRTLACLVDEGFLQKVEGKRYRLGQRVFELGLIAGQHFTEPRLAKPSLRRLADRIGATAVLAARSGRETVYLERMEGPEHFTGLRSAVGTRLPIGVGAGGIAMLAAMSPENVDAVIASNAARYRSFGRDTVQLLRTRIAQAHADGYASTTSFLRSDVGSIAIVVPDTTNETTLALSIVCGAARLKHAPELASEIRIAALEVATAIRGGDGCCTNPL